MPLIRKILAPESHCEIIAGYHCGIVAINSTVTFLLLKGKAKQIELPSGVEKLWSRLIQISMFYFYGDFKFTEISNEEEMLYTC